jgi:hypothetical protein
MKDKFYLIRNHPRGGFAAVEMLCEHDYHHEVDEEFHIDFETVEKAEEFLAIWFPDHLVAYHSEITGKPSVTELIEKTLMDSARVMAEADKELVRLYKIERDIRSFAIDMVNSLTITTDGPQKKSTLNILGENLLKIIGEKNEQGN